MNDEKPRKRPTEIAIEIVEPFIQNPLGSPLDVPAGLRWSLKTRIADAIRRERVVIFKLRDAASAAAAELSGSYERLAAPLREAVEFSQAEEDLTLPAFNSRLFEHSPSSRIACLDVSELTPGRLTFAFEDTYSGKGFTLTFDAKSEVLCLARLDGASAEQVGSMVAFALEDLRLRREKGA